VPIAAFESEPQASAAGTVLRELGFDADVIVRGANTFEARTQDFFAGKPAPFEPHAVLVSDAADPGSFVRTVQRHYGIVLEPE
jgi:hypothetical protein